jgi:hypothetical protein
MPQEIRVIASRLLAEIRKDIFFFGPCGALVGLLMLWQFKLTTLGVASGKAWPTELFSDFVSFNAFTLVFIGLIAVSSVSTLARAFGQPLPRLEAAVTHLEERLSQIASSIISFTLGLSTLALLHALLTLEKGGFALAFLVVLFNWLIFCGFVTAAAIARRIEPFNKWGPSLLALVGALFFVGWFLVKGVT